MYDSELSSTVEPELLCNRRRSLPTQFSLPDNATLDINTSEPWYIWSPLCSHLPGYGLPADDPSDCRLLVCTAQAHKNCFAWRPERRENESDY